MTEPGYIVFEDPFLFPPAFWVIGESAGFSPFNGVLDKVAGKPYLTRVLRLFKSVVSLLMSETLNGDYNE